MKSKPTLALLHGWGMNPRVFDALGAQLKDDCTLLPLALPGHGGTRILSTDSLATWASHIAEQLPAQTIVLGWSLGGQIAMRIALDFPERVSRLILMSTTPKFVLAPDWQAGIPAQDLHVFVADMRADTRATLLRFLSLQTRGTTGQKTLLQTLRTSLFSQALPHAHALQAGLEMLLQNDLRAEVKHIAQPTTVIHGSVDKLTPSAAGEWLAKHLASARYHMIDGAAHAPFLSHTQQVAEVILEVLHDG